MSTQVLDAGKASHSPSSYLMELTNVDHMYDFQQVVEFLEANLDKVITEVHGFDKLLIDDGKTQLNCPPAPEPGDSHGSLLIRTFSEKAGPDGITLTREFKVHDLGVDPDYEGHHKVEIREDIMGPSPTENVVVASIARGV